MKLKDIEENEKVSNYFILVKIGYTEFLLPYEDAMILITSFKKAMVHERDFSDGEYTSSFIKMKETEIEIRHMDNDQVKNILATQRLIEG